MTLIMTTLIGGNLFTSVNRDNQVSGVNVGVEEMAHFFPKLHQKSTKTFNVLKFAAMYKPFLSLGHGGWH
jgi:hypothetical protein